MALTPKVRIEDILNRVELYRPELDEDLLRHAYIFAANRHQGQVRRSGEAYFVHPLTVAWILAQMELDEVAIAAGLLHDILEDTETTEAELETEFGSQVSRLVVALTKISVYESSYTTREETDAENFRRLLLASIDDVRVILIKLADRLHNMRTLNFLRRERQVAIAQETLEIYAPISNRLGIGSIKGELEDLCFRYLHPHAAERLENEIEERAAAAKRWFSRIQDELAELTGEHDILGTIEGRVKHHYSVYRKLKAQGIDVSNVFDFLAFRIIVPTVADCYSTLGLIHQQWSPVPGRIKDYIAMPKPNAYQSLHTSVIGPEGHPFEIQIRTEAMHKIAEFGIAAHWSYKEGDAAEVEQDSRVTWLRSLLDNSTGSSPREFLDSLKVDLYPDEVYAFTPKGDVFSFPAGAALLDFAYRIHTEVGHTCVGGRVNGRWVPLKTALKNGDIVEISTSPQQAPHHDWLTLVGTNKARSKIRAHLKREEKVRAIEVGRKLFEREIRRRGVGLKRVLGSDEMKEALVGHGLAKEEDLFAALGFGRLSAQAIAAQVVPDQGAEAPSAPPEDRWATVPKGPKDGGGGLEVTGDPDFLVYVAQCCAPVRGEDIVGFVTRGKGVAVHARSCPNVKNLLYHPEREIPVRWSRGSGGGDGQGSQVGLDMVFLNDPAMLTSISQAISAEGAGIVSCHLQTEQVEERGSASITVMVDDADHLRRVIDRLLSLKGMHEVERRSGRGQFSKAVASRG
ncbi:MAG: bifunctional (p)ppGpp synthetase/guanosine-3',5'-bis(diphosphate) 3'-pyrophosphohydrolase [Acidobacteriota bacterium]